MAVFAVICGSKREWAASLRCLTRNVLLVLRSAVTHSGCCGENTTTLASFAAEVSASRSRVTSGGPGSKSIRSALFLLFRTNSFFFMDAMKVCPFFLQFTGRIPHRIHSVTTRRRGSSCRFLCNEGPPLLSCHAKRDFFYISM